MRSTHSFLVLFLFVDIPEPTDVIERIRQLYKTREERLLPVPWCEDFSFNLNEIFTRLRIVGKDKTRGELTADITNMTAIFKPHKECGKPRTVLIEGDPGMGKTTYCQKLAYDWATKQENWDKSFPMITVLLLLRCHDIKSNIWEAVDEQILPDDIDEESKENFFKFIRENQSKVLLVLDGLDETDQSKLGMYIKLAESRELPKCHIVFTSRHESGMKVRRYCDTLWEILGFEEIDARRFILKYFKNKKPLADKLLKELSRWSRSDLRELTSNPLNTALLCILCEDFKGVLPKSRTQLYIEIVQCVLRRYEKKNGLLSNSEDLIEVYKKELLSLGHRALESLIKGEYYIEESRIADHLSGNNLDALRKFGFLSIQPGGSRRKPCFIYGFLHKSFQEFFAGFYLASNILKGETDLDIAVTDDRFLGELNQVFSFMSGLVVSQCEETAVRFLNSITSCINSLGRHTSDKGFAGINRKIQLLFSFIMQCVNCKESLQSQFLNEFGSHLDLVALTLKPPVLYQELFFKSLSVNTSLTDLDLYGNDIDASGAASLSEVLSVNTTLTNLKLKGNKIGASGAASLSKRGLSVNTALTNLNLSSNKIGDSGAASLSEALTVNTTLTNLYLQGNKIGASGGSSLSEALTVNTTLTNLDLSDNEIDASGAASLSEALSVNTALTNLNLRSNTIGDSGAASLSEALSANAALTKLNLSSNKIGDFGAASLSKALSVNSTLTDLDLSGNTISESGAASLYTALTVNSTLTDLNLYDNKIVDSGAALLSEALSINTTLTNLDLRYNEIGASGAASLSEALSVNTTLTNLSLTGGKIRASGAASLSTALSVNTTLTNLILGWNQIGNSGAAFLSKALLVNTALTNLDLRYNEIGASGAASLSEALSVNTALTDVDLTGNKIGDPGAASLSEALSVNSALTDVDLTGNKIGDSGAAFLSKALSVNTALTYLHLSCNNIGDSGAVSLSEALSVNTSLTHLYLACNNIGDSGVASLSKALSVSTTLTDLDISGNSIRYKGRFNF